MQFTKKELKELVKEEIVRKERIKELEAKKARINGELKALNAEDFEPAKEVSFTIDEWVMQEEEAAIISEKKKPSAGLSKEKRSAVVKAAKAGKDIGKKGKGFKKVEAKAAKDPKVKDPKAVAAAAMWKNIKR